MTYPVAIECRKKLAYSEKMARESQDPDEIQKYQSLAEWGNLIQKQIMYASNGERERIGPEAARAREKQFVRDMVVLSRRFLSAQNHSTTEAGEDSVVDEDAPRKKPCKGKKDTQKIQASYSYPVDDELTLKKAQRRVLQSPHQDWSLHVPLGQSYALLEALMLSESEGKE
ncbi:hypothetical protein Neosp_001871 [[Neocosmospora] mangrovei]